MILICPLFTWINGQSLKVFTHDPTVFLVELNSLFQTIQNKENKAKALSTFNEFSGLWNYGNYDNNHRETIYRSADLMLQRKLRAYPDFERYISALVAFKTMDVSFENFDLWLKITCNLLENTNSIKSYHELLLFTEDFLESGILNKSKIFSWVAGKTPFRFIIADSVFLVQIERFHLSCKTRNDSSTIFRTSGYYSPVSKEWKGKGGAVTWRRANLPENEVYADLDDYAIDMKTAAFQANNVAFHYEKYFKGSMNGHLVERVSADIVNPENALYPRFESDMQSVFIEGIFQDIDYEGGFMLRGTKMIGSGFNDRPAKLIFKRLYRDKKGDYDLITARSDEFIITNEKIGSENIAVTIIHQDDSIVHTGLQLRYTHQNRQLVLYRQGPGVEQSPFFDSFHKVEFDSEALYWQMNDDVIYLGAMPGLKNQSKAYFVSDNFFSEAHFDRVMGLDRKHPLLWLDQYSKTFNTREFKIEQLADFIRMPESQVEAQVIRLAIQGFVHYDIAQRKAFITDKVSHYIKAKSKLVDYDVIEFQSEVDSRINAEIKLENFDLSIKGVPHISLSNAKKVAINPTEQEITLRKNRDFIFSGQIKAGLFDFQATECHFNYDTFRLNMPTIDTMRFKVNSFETDDYGKRKLVEIKTPITNISGQMLIDHPANKSGLVLQPRYPIFTSNKESFVYFDQKPEFKEAYNRDLVNYYIEPFTFENLEEFETESIRFRGFFNSGGIFPDNIDHPLEIMPDYSLGFKKQTPPEGYPVYQGKGKFFNEITVNLSGLKGDGKLEYLNSTSVSKDFIFYLDSVSSSNTEFNITPLTKGKTEFPPVKGLNLNQLWRPYSDSMVLQTTDLPISMFDERASLKGSMILTSDALTGAGELDFLNATALSDKFAFTANAFYSDTTKLKLRSLPQSDVVFNTENYSAFVDFNTKIGNFKTNSINSKIYLPAIRYESFLNEFDWYFDSNEVELYSYAKVDESGYDTLTKAELIGKPLSGAKFVSTHSKQNSLEFYSSRANYDLTNNILKATDVKLIKIADVAIYPDDGLLEIHENAVVQPLNNAIIIADTINRNHTITDAEVEIQSGSVYKAKGNYAFSNFIGEVQNVTFDQISVDADSQTVATGTVGEGDHFELSPRFAFKGEISLNARNPLLNFKGGYRIIQNCDSTLSRWVNFEQRIDPEDITLPVPEQLLEHGYKKLYAGFFYSNEENKIYPAFLSMKNYYSDSLLFSVNGFLKNRKNGAELLIIPSSQIGLEDDEAPNPPFLSWNIDHCSISGRGTLNFGQDFGRLKMDLYGEIEHNIFNDTSWFNVMMTVNFHFAENAFLIMAEDLASTQKPEINIENKLFKEGLTSLAGSSEVEKIYNDLTLYGQIRKIPDALLKSFIFTDLKMTYHTDSRSFISKGPIGVAMVYGNPVFKYFDGYVQIVRRRSGDELNIYIELERGHWYFFNYKTYQMLASSSRTDFNSAMKDMKPSARKEDERKGEPSYRFNISPDTQAKNRFLRFIQQLESKEEEYE
ncbi:MAG TPA: hypothetical protein PK376_08755 [Bacteroidales bacterium]|nr:MAG: hypothetical protein BWX63_01852 [Bacteroidetes bacterium ADurb.Bin041]HPW43881.1 hypothetical protein [Bacteroidales bacterium]